MGAAGRKSQVRQVMEQSQVFSGGRNGRSDAPAWMRRAVWAAEMLVIAGLAFAIARLIWLLAFGASAADFQVDARSAGADRGGIAYEADINLLREARLFADRRTVEAVVETVEDAPETRLNLTLRGVRAGDQPETGSAFIQTPDNRQHSFAVGAEIIDGVTLESVYADRVIINRRGINESLYLRDPDSRPVRTTASNPATAAAPSRADLARRTPSAASSLFQVEPVLRNNQLIGYRFGSGARPLLESLGLSANDIITAIDGQALADVDDVQDFFEDIRSRDTLSISVLRNGNPMTLQVDLP